MAALQTMGLSFRHLLEIHAVNPADVRLLRHQGSGVITPFELWRTAPTQFDLYQSKQGRNANLGTDLIWASFVAPTKTQSLFVGLYKATLRGPTTETFHDPVTGRRFAPGELDDFSLQRLPALSDLEGRLAIEWGAGYRAWVQRADNDTKAVAEIKPTMFEPPFPGPDTFEASLLALETLPPSWATALASQRGIYLFTCPRTNEQYVGAAPGTEGFWGRWLNYCANGHGGNVEMIDREPSDYRICILETARSTDDVATIYAREAMWKRKLKPKLNRN